MARVQYKGSARARGYRPEQADERRLARIREEGERRLQGMRAAADANIQQRKEVLQAMKENEAYTKGAMQRDYQTAIGNQQRIANGLQAEARRDQQQFANDEKSRTAILDTIKGLSKTAGEEATKAYERRRTEEFNATVARGMTEENLLEKAVAQKALADQSMAIDNATVEFEANGGDKVVAAQVRAQSDALATDFTEGQIAAYWRWKYPDQRNAYLAQKAQEFGRALTPEEEQYYTGEFRGMVVELMGRQTGFAAKLITPYVQQYGDTADANKFAETRRQQKKIADDRVLGMSVTNIANADPTEIQRVLHTSYNSMYHIQGHTKTWNDIEEVYQRIDPRSDKYLRNADELLNFEFIDENGRKTTYLKKFGESRYLEFLVKRDKAMTDHLSAKQKAYDVGKQDYLNNKIRGLSPNYTEAEVDALESDITQKYPGWNPVQIVNLRKKGTVEALTREAELDRILGKNDWELTERDGRIVDMYGTPEQKAIYKTRYESGNGSIYSKEVDNIIKQGQSIITGQNSYSDLAKTGSMPAAIFFDRNVRAKMRELLAGDKVTGSTPTERAENAANIAVELEQQKVRAGEGRDGTGPYQVKRFRNSRVEYPLIKKALGDYDVILEHERRVDAMREQIIRGDASGFVKNPDSIFTDERMAALMENPNLPPNSFEIAAAQALGIGHHDLRNLGAKAKGFTFNFKDVLLEGTGVALTPELARTMAPIGPQHRRAELEARTNPENYRDLAVHGRAGFMGVPVEQTKEYPIVLENGQPIRIARGPASNAFDQMLEAGMPTEGITNVFRDEKEYLRLRKAGYGAAPNSYHNHGLAIDAHGPAGDWLHKYGAQYGWVQEPGYVGHGGHFIFKPST